MRVDVWTRLEARSYTGVLHFSFAKQPQQLLLLCCSRLNSVDGLRAALLWRHCVKLRCCGRAMADGSVAGRRAELGNAAMSTCAGWCKYHERVNRQSGRC
jgi:hypothetical protein